MAESELIKANGEIVKGVTEGFLKMKDAKERLAR